MWAYIICTAIWISFILHWTISSIPKRRVFEIYAGCGISICLTLLVFGLSSWYKMPVSEIVQFIGDILVFVAIALAIIALGTLKVRGKPEKGIEDTKVLIEGTIFGVIRHPLYLGLMIWGISQILKIQSILATILGVTAIFCFWMAAKKEDEFNINKFGDGYREYMRKVPMCNVFKGLRR